MAHTTGTVQPQDQGSGTLRLGGADSSSRHPLEIISDAIDKVTESCYVIATAAFALVMLLGVFFRYVLNNSLSWSDEVAVVFFVWAAFLSATTGYLHDKHVSMGLRMTWLSPGWHVAIKVLAEGLAGAFLVSLTVSGIEALEVAGRSHTDSLRLPMTVPYFAIPICAALMTFHWCRRNMVATSWTSLLIKTTIALGLFGLLHLPIGQHIQLMGTPKLLLLTASFALPLLIGVPVAFSLGLVAFTYLSLFGNVPFDTGALQIFFGTDAITLLAVPLLMLSGTLMHAAGIADRLVNFAQVVVGRLRGGLGATNVLASFLFGDISGSSVSDTAAIGALMIPTMKARGYRADFCAALQGASGTLGMTAPLSIVLLLYAVSIGASVSRLAAATIIPAFVLAGSFMLVTLVHARRHGYPREEVPREVILPRLLAAIPGLFALVIVLGGILGGVCTPAEVGTILLTYVLLLSILFYHSAPPRLLYRTTIKAGYTSGMTLFLVSCSCFFGFVVARDLLSIIVVDFLTQLSTNKYVMLFMLQMVFLILGMVLEAAPIIFGFMPTFMPLIALSEIDPVHWGVLFVVNMGLGMIVPPVALNLFISTQIAEVRYGEAVRACIPFMLIMALNIVIVAVFPKISLLVPHLLFGYPMK